MDIEPKSKKQNQNDGVDRISDLHDSILCKILSLLPIKDVIGSSILSKRWNKLFPFGYPLIRLDIDYTSFSNYNAFVCFMDNLFKSTLANVPCVEILKLYCKSEFFGDEKTTSWVCAALRLKVRELLLEIYLEHSETWFRGLNGCTNLTILKVGVAFRVLVPDRFTLPNLKVLYLYTLCFYSADGDMFSKLIRGCPELEELSVRCCRFESWKGFPCIRSSLLKKLVVNCGPGFMCGLELDVPNLEVLEYGYICPHKILCNFKSLRAARIYAGLDREENGEKDITTAAFVAACSSTVYLRLATTTIDALQHSQTQLPEFQNLTTLALGRVMKSEGWMLLAHLLLHTPNLEKLMFEKWFDERGYSKFEALLPNPPICLELHLREIRFKVFHEGEDELKLVEYFLKKGKVIQKLKIHCLPFKEAKTSRLLMLPKHSKIDFQPRPYKCHQCNSQNFGV